MMNVKARAVNGPDSEFFATENKRCDLDKHDILIEIKYAGICHSDIHTAREEWGPVDYPLVPGHEIAGIVKEVGPNVTKYKVDAPAEPVSLQVFNLIDHRRSFAGSAIGGIKETQEMLDFCSEHHIAPQIELITADDIDDAYERVLASKVKYRFVIDISTM
ncbi:alcohol dehydrogenase catalytic domain-containing protein [Staphylococcus hominis]|uniref:alcohol dehydrogenase catalytic domain-containing protein n=1 Tax=Staphylococcus hominis TaxID=1290 RepID=UPI002DBACC8E|nr:alcohol dehydrogenase catalytic domain-containing protein [Staphylococcus hominis]MEB5793363.1 alcohol dehydrogenase catalytic domain-containing protein [Staphylococcus hominis]